jgi:hypothetical protein
MTGSGRKQSLKISSPRKHEHILIRYACTILDAKNAQNFPKLAASIVGAAAK